MLFYGFLYLIHTSFNSLVSFFCFILTVSDLWVPIRLLQDTSNVFGKSKLMLNKSIIIKHFLLLKTSQSNKKIKLKNIIEILHHEWRS